jgi:hypothetical protein
MDIIHVKRQVVLKCVTQIGLELTAQPFANQRMIQVGIMLALKILE